MRTIERNRGYASYLLRLRQVRNGNQAIWVASVQSTATGEQRSFSSVYALAQFLQTEFGSRELTPEPEPVV